MVGDYSRLLVEVWDEESTDDLQSKNQVKVDIWAHNLNLGVGYEGRHERDVEHNNDLVEKEESTVGHSTVAVEGHVPPRCLHCLKIALYCGISRFIPID